MQEEPEKVLDSSQQSQIQDVSNSLLIKQECLAEEINKDSLNTSNTDDSKCQLTEENHSEQAEAVNNEEIQVKAENDAGAVVEELEVLLTNINSEPDQTTNTDLQEEKCPSPQAVQSEKTITTDNDSQAENQVEIVNNEQSDLQESSEKLSTPDEEILIINPPTIEALNSTLNPPETEIEINNSDHEEDLLNKFVENSAEFQVIDTTGYDPEHPTEDNDGVYSTKQDPNMEKNKPRNWERLISDTEKVKKLSKVQRMNVLDYIESEIIARDLQPDNLPHDLRNALSRVSTPLRKDFLKSLHMKLAINKLQDGLKLPIGSSEGMVAQIADTTKREVVQDVTNSLSQWLALELSDTILQNNTKASSKKKLGKPPVPLAQQQIFLENLARKIERQGLDPRNLPGWVWKEIGRVSRNKRNKFLVDIKTKAKPRQDHPSNKNKNSRSSKITNRSSSFSDTSQTSNNFKQRKQLVRKETFSFNTAMDSKPSTDSFASLRIASPSEQSSMERNYNEPNFIPLNDNCQTERGKNIFGGTSSSHEYYHNSKGAMEDASFQTERGKNIFGGTFPQYARDHKGARDEPSIQTEHSKNTYGSTSTSHQYSRNSRGAMDETSFQTEYEKNIFGSSSTSHQYSRNSKGAMQENSFQTVCGDNDFAFGGSSTTPHLHSRSSSKRAREETSRPSSSYGGSFSQRGQDFSTQINDNTFKRSKNPYGYRYAEKPGNFPPRNATISNRDTYSAERATSKRKLDDYDASNVQGQPKRPHFDHKQSDDDSKQIIIADESSATGTMNQKQADVLSAKLVQMLDQSSMSSYGHIPRFYNSKLVNGLFRITCADQKSIEWVRNVVANLPELWRGARLRVEPFRQFSAGKVSVYVFMPGVKDKPAEILQRLERQNPGLNTGFWRIYRHSENKRGQFFCIYIDESSLEVLKKMNLKPFFGLSTISFHMGDPPEGKRQKHR